MKFEILCRQLVDLLKQQKNIERHLQLIVDAVESKVQDVSDFEIVAEPVEEVKEIEKCVKKS